MLSRSTALLPLCAAQQQQTRGMATLKAISMRLRSVKNIQKITKSMKMVSAAKYARAERELKPARAYGIGAKTFYEAAEIGQAEEGEAAAPGSQLLIAVTSDRGLCGAVHSSIAKHIRNTYEPAGNFKIVCVGDKSRTILQRTHRDNILFQVTEVGKKAPSFADATAVAQEILSSGYEFDSGNIFFNIFKSVVSYETSALPVYSMGTVAAAPKLTVYDSLDADVTQSYLEFSLASMLYYAMKEGACSEQSSRMTAMDNASKNAGEMIDKLTLTFNRTRQAVITRELIEIISGAAALK